MSDRCGCGHLISAHAANGKCTEWWRYPDVLDARQCGCIEVRPPNAPERPANALSRPQSAEEGELGVSGRMGDGERLGGAEGEWTAALAAELRANTPLTGWQRDLRDYALSPTQARNLADALLPTVRRIVAGELRAAAANVNDSEDAADIRARADVLDSTDHGKA